MKDVIEVKGETYKSVGVLKERFDISNFTIRTLLAKGLLPQPLWIGKTRYFREDRVEELLSKGQ